MERSNRSVQEICLTWGEDSEGERVDMISVTLGAWPEDLKQGNLTLVCAGVSIPVKLEGWTRTKYGNDEYYNYHLTIKEDDNE